MPNNIQNLPADQKTTIAANQEIKRFNRALYSIRFKIIDYVRNANNVNDAIQRATTARTQIMTLLEELGINPVDIPTATARAAEAVDAASARRCQPPRVWDPITETCG